MDEHRNDDSFHSNSHDDANETLITIDDVNIDNDESRNDNFSQKELFAKVQENMMNQFQKLRDETNESLLRMQAFMTENIKKQLRTNKNETLFRESTNFPETNMACGDNGVNIQHNLPAHDEMHFVPSYSLGTDRVDHNAGVTTNKFPKFNGGRNSAPFVDDCNYGLQNQSQATSNQELPPLASQSFPSENYSSPSFNNRASHMGRHDNHKVHMKPQSFTGSEDLDEYLTQFEILSEINMWDYHSKSLYLAGSLKGPALSLLNDLDPVKRHDYYSLIQALHSRYGSVNKAEMYRAQLQSRVKCKEESIPDLAQSIRKLTRQSYPGAPPFLTDILSVDHFIDAIHDPDIRLRLREARPKSISEAETLAVRLETYKLADNKRHRPVRSLEMLDDVNNAVCSIDTTQKKSVLLKK